MFTIKMNIVHNNLIPLILRAEGLALFGASLVAYHWLGGSWTTFLWLFLLPDIAMTGYAKDIRTGTLAYNIAHSYVTVVAVAAIFSWSPLFLIWVAHIAFDRMLGFGLKLEAGFRFTHLTLIPDPARETAPSSR